MSHDQIMKLPPYQVKTVKNLYTGGTPNGINTVHTGAQ